MTHVSYESYHDLHIFECVGHTGYSSLGTDILCSAISCLCYTLDAYLQKGYDEGSITNFVSDFSDGYVRLQFEYCDKYDSQRCDEAINAVLSGFTLLEQSYPDYIDTDL